MDTSLVSTFKISYYLLSLAERKDGIYKNNQIVAYEGCFGFRLHVNANERRQCAHYIPFYPRALYSMDCV